MGLSWVTFGTPLWVLDLATGGELLWTSLGTHLVAPAVAILALRRRAWPRGSWLVAWLAAVVLLLGTRVATPPAANVNVAFAVPSGWTTWFPSHAWYLTLLLTAAASTFALVEVTARRFLPASG